jgi:hypothetical protein
MRRLWHWKRWMAGAQRKECMKKPIYSEEVAPADEDGPAIHIVYDADNEEITGRVWAHDAEAIVTACNAHDQLVEFRNSLVHELRMIGIKAEAGLCQITHQGTRTFHTDIRDIVKRTLTAAGAA